MGTTPRNGGTAKVPLHGRSPSNASSDSMTVVRPFRDVVYTRGSRRIRLINSCASTSASYKLGRRARSPGD
jgi:hypothetical protein